MIYQNDMTDDTIVPASLESDRETGEIANKLSSDFTGVGKDNFADLLASLNGGKTEAKELPGLTLIDFKVENKLNAQPAQRLKNAEAQKSARLVDKLGSDSYLVRERAHRKLDVMGTKAIPYLIDGLKNEDLEIKRRSGQLLEKYLKPSVRSMEDILNQTSVKMGHEAIIDIDHSKAALQDRLDRLEDHLKNPQMRERRVKTINTLLKAAKEGRLSLSTKELKSLRQEKDLIKSPETIKKAQAVTLVEMADLSGDDRQAQLQFLSDAMRFDPRIIEQDAFKFIVKFSEIAKDSDFANQFKDGSAFMKKFKAAGGSIDKVRKLQTLFKEGKN